MRVNHNIPALNAWRQGTITQRAMSKSLERLSSGLRINRAADDAAGLAISEKMRAQIKGLDQATRNAQDGISLIQTAEGALNESHSILQRMRELSVQAANDTYTSTDRQEIQKEINQLTSEIDRISATTEFNQKKLLDGSTSALVSTDALETKVFMRGGLRVLDQFGQKEAGGGNYKLNITAEAGKNEVQKSDVMKVKHGLEGATDVGATTYEFKGVKFHGGSGYTSYIYGDVAMGGGTLATANFNSSFELTIGTSVISGTFSNGTQVTTATAAAASIAAAITAAIEAAGNSADLKALVTVTNAGGTLKVDADSYDSEFSFKFEITANDEDNYLTFGEIGESTDDKGETGSIEVSTTDVPVGEIAKENNSLYDIDRFWDKSGNFILEDPQTITLVQGDGKETAITLSGADTIEDVVDKLNSAIAEGLGQGELVGSANEEKFVSFVQENGTDSAGLDTSGFETVAGTFVIRSAIAGNEGKITFVGDDDTINALSLTTIQKAENNSYTVDVTNAHNGDIVASSVKVSENQINGVVHENVDVEFAANAGIDVTYNATDNNFELTGGADNAENTFVHLADRTMVLHIGANQKQDIGTGIGNMSADSLGVDNIQVTSNSLANEAIGKIDSAISMVSGERSKLGAIQNRLDHTINNLGVTMENLTSAESRIRDADMAKEMMQFTKLQILSQSANAMLSQANQLPNNVLQLLR